MTFCIGLGMEFSNMLYKCLLARRVKLSFQRIGKASSRRKPFCFVNSYRKFATGTCTCPHLQQMWNNCYTLFVRSLTPRPLPRFVTPPRHRTATTDISHHNGHIKSEKKGDVYAHRVRGQHVRAAPQACWRCLCSFLEMRVLCSVGECADVQRVRFPSRACDVRAVTRAYTNTPEVREVQYAKCVVACCNGSARVDF